MNMFFRVQKTILKEPLVECAINPVLGLRISLEYERPVDLYRISLSTRGGGINSKVHIATYDTKDEATAKFNEMMTAIENGELIWDANV